MLEVGKHVSILGTLVVDCITKDFIDMDAYDNGKVSTVDRRAEEGKYEFDENGAPKAFDGYQEGDFISFGGIYKVLEPREFSTLVEIDGDKVLIPNSRLMEVD